MIYFKEAAVIVAFGIKEDAPLDSRICFFDLKLIKP